jgi:GxxExxY protein
MPITPSLLLRPVSDDEFAVIDEAVMRCAYSVQNKFGRFFDEQVYENDLAARLRAEGFEVHTQVPIAVTHQRFKTTCFLDLVVNHMLYELKVVSTLTGEHDAQALHYAMLQDIPLVKLINFGEQRVRGRLLCNALRTADRYHSTLCNSGLRLVTPNCERLVSYFKAIIHDWGTHLFNHLYNEALVDFFGGEAHCARRMELWSGQLLLGTHRVQLHAYGHAFIVTSLSHDQAAYQEHLKVLLTHAKLKGIQWINLNHSRVEITTIERGVGSSMQAVE